MFVVVLVLLADAAVDVVIVVDVVADVKELASAFVDCRSGCLCSDDCCV